MRVIRNIKIGLTAVLRSNESFSEIYKECVIPSPCWLAYRNDFIGAGGFESDLYPEDYDLSFRFYAAGLKTQGTEGIIHLWRDHSTRTTRVSSHYSDNRFMQLKLHYFSKIDLKKDKQLVLWGAGKKGKTVAKYWSNQGLNFLWLTDNKKKIGHNIYDVIVQSAESFTANPNHQIVVAVADKSGQKEIQDALVDSNAETFWFC